MKRNKFTKKFNKDRWSSDKTCRYEAYGDDSSLVCFINDDKAIKSFRAYSEKTGEFIAVDASCGSLVSARCISSVPAEPIMKSNFRSMVIYSDELKSAVALAYVLLNEIHPDYFVSLDGTEANPEIAEYFENTVTDSDKGRILAEYLAAFEPKSTLIVTAEDLSKTLVSLLMSDKLRCIVILPRSCRQHMVGIPKLAIESIEVSISDNNNDEFKKLFLSTVDSFGIKIDDFAYAYLLNDINPTDTLDTVRKVAGRVRSLESVEEEYGTRILHNAVCCHDGCYTGGVAQCGAAYKKSTNDCIEIVRYLVSIGLRYGKAGRDDLADMGYDLYDSYKLGNIFRTMMEAGYYTTLEDLQAFVGNFISNAESNDHLTPIDDSHNPSYFQRLDKIRCEQFEEISPYLPDEIFLLRYTDGATLLTMAARRLENLPKLFKLILKRSPNVDAVDEDGCTALHYVGDLEKWDALIAAGASTDIKDKKGRIPAIGFDRDELQKLLDKKEYSDSDREYAERMLFSVIDDCYRAENVYDNEDIIMSLLDIIKPTAVRKWDGYTPLMAIIVQPGYFPEIYDKMLSIGIDINAMDNGGNNTLYVAVLSPECTTAKIRYLIKHGANGEGHNYKGSVATVAAGLFHIESPDWNALWELCDKSIFTYKNDEANSPIMVALYYQNMDAVRFLFNHDAVPEDEIDEVDEMIMGIRSKAIRIEALEYFSAYKSRNGIKENGSGKAE